MLGQIICVIAPSAFYIQHQIAIFNGIGIKFFLVGKHLSCIGDDALRFNVVFYAVVFLSTDPAKEQPLFAARCIELPFQCE